MNISHFIYICNVKLFAVLFSLFILTLSCMSCTDNQECHHESEAVTAMELDHSNHAQDDETCPPFCICACCGQTCASESLHLNFQLFESLNCAIKPVYCSGFADEIIFNIWQPPKVS